ncbi:unnamed protein product [Spirodela intermedia]|uniref:Uncharacterized protein n=1 Tax=Spirodela intermedia TaxID=51605 RepID=A0A7I8JP34_SPIIN|nr:unnamed protein product [Spirodela intermedia]CAA6671916.1 unnamed protein product [Spirodela intermedia]
MEPPPPPPPFEHRLDRTQHVAKHMQDTLTSSVCRVFCSIFLSLCSSPPSFVFIVWLSLRPHRPRFHLADFSAAGLSDNRTAAVFSFHVLLRNLIRRSASSTTSPCAASSSTTTTASAPPGRCCRRSTSSQEHDGHPGELPEPGLAVDQALLTRIRADLAATGEVWFRLRLEAAIRFRVKTWDTHQHDMKVDCDAGVRPDGSILPAAEGRRCPSTSSETSLIQCPPPFLSHLENLRRYLIT